MPYFFSHSASLFFYSHVIIHTPHLFLLYFSYFASSFYVLVSALSPLGCAILVSIVSDWALSIASNSLWMDCRIAARKALFSSLPLLVEKASKVLLRPVDFSDTPQHDLDDKQLMSGRSAEEQVYAYLCEACATCVTTLCADTPGLDPHAVGCVLRALRLCRTGPIVVEDLEPDSTSTDLICHVNAEGREREGDTEREGERESLQTSPLICQLKSAVAAYALKYCEIREPTLPSHDDVIIEIPFRTVGRDSNGMTNGSTQIQIQSEEIGGEEKDGVKKGEEENGVVDVGVEVKGGENGKEGEFSDTEFSDWDEEEDTENEHVSRRGTSYPSDDLIVLQDEIDMLQRYLKYSLIFNSSD
jgi:hypothetical protein